MKPFRCLAVFRALVSSRCVMAALATALSLSSSAFGAIDDNATQQIWKLKYGVTDAQIADPAWLNLDSDGDGVKNGGEMAAGTNPFDPTKTINVSSIVKNGSMADLAFPTEDGKLYRVQSTTTLTDANSWVLQPQPTPVQVIGDGTKKTLSVPYVANSFYRILVSDTDSDGDGVSDWAEKAASLNPNSAQTVPGTDDHVYVNQQIALPNVVTIAAAEPFASEDGPTAGRLTVTRTQNLFPITVNYGVGGTAVPSTDYSPLSGSVTFSARGATTADIFVNPMVLPTVRGGRSVTATLAPPSPSAVPFTLGAQSSATVIINDSTAPTGTGLLARYYDTSSSTAADAANFGQSGTFTYTRVGSTPYAGSTIVIPFTYNGSPALQVGHLVKLTFTSGSLNSPTFNHLNYTVTAVTPGVSFTVGISGATLPTSYNPTGSFSIQSFPHPAVIERVDPVVNNDWGYGTPNDVSITPNNPVDNYSSVFEGYLSPSTAGNYQFQLDADDKARVLIDLNGDGDFLDAGEQVIEHGWDGPATVGTFKQSAAVALAVPASAAQRYKIRVEHVETTGDARCRLQWLVPGTTSYVNIPQANVFSHTQATSYSYTRNGDLVSGSILVTPSGGHAYAVGNQVSLLFSSGNLFTPPANLHGNYTITAVSGTFPTNTFTVAITGAGLPATGTGNGFVVNSASATTGWLNQVYANTTFTAPPGNVGVLGSGATNSNNGIWGSGTPDATLIGKDTFSVRWTGQVQPQYSEEYTFVVQSDDGCSLWLNGQLQEMKTLPSTITGIATYDYSSTNGDAIINYTTGAVKPGSFIVGESVRVDPSSGNLTHGTGSTYTFDGVTGYLTVDYSNLSNIAPGGFLPGETIELDPTGGTLSSLANLPYVIVDEPTTTTFRVFIGAGIFDTQATSAAATINIADTRNAVVSKLFATGATYNYNSSTGALVVTYSTVTGVAASAFTAGMTVELDPTSGNLSALTNASYSITAATATTFTVNIGTGLFTNGSTGNINIASTANGVIPASITNAFAINFGTAKYTTGTGNINVEIANKPLKEWSSMGNERYVHIPMIGGTRYDIQLDFSENTGYSRCILSWYSASQPKQVIPAERLYPKSVPQAPPAHVSPTESTALVNGQFSYQVVGTNGSTVTVSGNPAWLTYSGGVLSGTPPAGAAGDYQIVITATNAAGTGTSVLNLHVDENAGTVPREFWSGVAGTSVSNIPTGTAPTGTASLTSLEAPSNFGTDYGARIRGYITAPVTGNYYFWIAANNSAELWISNDDEPINIFKRASVLTGNATPQTWNGEANQKSPWLALEQGKKYYFEVLHKAGSGAGDNLAVGWAKPGQASTAPSQVVPGYALSPYVPPAVGSTPGTLFVASMLSQNSASTNGVGSSSLRLSEDETVAYMRYTYSGLTGPISNQHIHIDPNPGHNDGEIVYDIDTPATPGDGLITNPGDPNVGAYKWTIAGLGTYSASQILDALKSGKAYINLHTALYAAGEIRGNYTLAVGSRTFTPPPAPLSWTDDAALAGSAGDAARARFLTQATFGPNIADMTALKNLGSYEAWIDDQFNMSPSLTSHQLPEVIRTENASAQGGAFASSLTFNAWWKDSIAGPDQLRQRVAFALSEIHVVSAQGPLENNALATSYFYDKLADNAFGNFRDILKDTTLTPSMGRYLDMLRNDKPDQTVGRIPNENYAREIKQLFSVGLYRMWPDGTLMLTSKDAPIDTYTQREIVGLAHVFTGWDYGYDGPFHTSFSSATNWTRQMRETPARHYTGPKRTLNNEVLPGLPSMGGQLLDPNATHTFNNYTDATYQALPAQELEKAHDLLFNHPNVGPFICRQLIQRLVTSNPSRDYLYRVVQKFNDNGSGVRGDMKAVIKAILLDYEARSPALLNIPAYGKQREAVMRVAAAGRAFRPTAFSGTYAQTATPISTARNITITTATPHNLATGNNVFLEFNSGSPAPWIGSYSATVTGANAFTVIAQGWVTGTYNQPAGSNVMTITMSSHWLQAGQKAFFVFTSGTAVGLAGLDNQANAAVTSDSTDNPNAVAGTTFTVTSPDTTARSGNVMIPRFSPGSYTISASGLAAPNDRRVTMDTNVNHELNVGDQVQINFYDGNPKPADMVVTVESVVDLNTWTFLAPSAGTNLGTIQALDQVFQFPLKALPLARTGNLGSRPSTFAMGNTTTDLEQTPINSPTVFNFFLPDFKYPGALASQGITTPEFQLTAETTAIRQANFLYNGVFNPTSNTSGLSSFISGNNSLVMDTSPWMGATASDLGLGAPANLTVPWTHNQNIPTLINQLSTLLAAGQLSSNVKAVIQNFIERPIASIAPGSPATNPCIVTTVGNHGYTTGDSVVISGVANGTFSPSGAFGSTTTARTITVTGPTTFTVTGVTCTVAPTGISNAHVSPVAYNMGTTTPTATEKRDRLRSIIHFILTSPDFTIQR